MLLRGVQPQGPHRTSGAEERDAAPDSGRQRGHAGHIPAPPLAGPLYWTELIHILTTTCYHPPSASTCEDKGCILGHGYVLTEESSLLCVWGPTGRPLRNHVHPREHCRYI